MKLEFSKQGYQSLLNLILKEGFVIKPICENSKSESQKTILLRHDVDFSIDYALQMAQMEHEMGVRSTYFVLLYNDFYNPLAPEGKKKIHQIRKLGHEIGLHWDCVQYPKSPEELGKYLQLDLQILERLVGEKIRSASQHNPIDSPYFDISKFIEFETYSEPIKSKFAYVSDSAMTWRSKTPVDFVNEGNDFQLLIHPVWWMAEGASSADKLRSLIPASSGEHGQKVEEFIDYMNYCLRERQRMDKEFFEKRAKS